LVFITVLILNTVVLPYYDKTRNATLKVKPYEVSEKVRTIHNAAFVADLHADALLWGRNLEHHHERGHVDLPRLTEGGVDLQVFGVVSKVPESLNYHANPADSDILPLLFIATLHSPETWFSPKQRALAQAETLNDMSSVKLVLNKEDLNEAGFKGLLALEGMHALEGDAKTLDEFYTAGFRMMGLTHFFDNAMAGSAHGVEQYGLTELGRSLIPQMETLGMTVDLAHASSIAIDDTLKLAARPVVVSHTGVKGTCPGPRNLSDEQLRGIAANGGVIGIGYWKGAVCDASVKGITRAILYAVRVAGVDHVGLGSDFDGHVSTPFDVTGVPLITESLLASGLSEEDVGKILGGNVKRVLAGNLPE